MSEYGLTDHEESIGCTISDVSPERASYLVCENPILIGGCGSSGTTLLRTLLNTHSQVACGPEMSVFDRPAIYQMSMTDFFNHWESKAFSCFEPDCIFPISFNGGTYFAHHRDEYHDAVVASRFFSRASEVRDFWSLYFSVYAQRKGKLVWAEKTPNNVYCAKRWLEWFPEGRFINIIRDGRDAVTSLVETRGFDPVKAIYRWLTAVNAYQEIIDDPRVFCVRYENLVKHPEATMRFLFEWLELEWEHNVYTENEVHQLSIDRWLKADDFLIEQMALTLKGKLFEMGYY